LAARQSQVGWAAQVEGRGAQAIVVWHTELPAATARRSEQSWVAASQ
jgi:hypothetical protein